MGFKFEGKMLIPTRKYLVALWLVDCARFQRQISVYKVLIAEGENPSAFPWNAVESEEGSKWPFRRHLCSPNESHSPHCCRPSQYLGVCLGEGGILISDQCSAHCVPWQLVTSPWVWRHAKKQLTSVCMSIAVSKAAAVPLLIESLAGCFTPWTWP